MAPPPLQTQAERELELLTTHRGRLADDRPIRLAAAVSALWVAGFALASVLLRGSGRGALYLGDGVALAPVVAMAALVALAALRTLGRTRLFWGALLLSSLAWLAGDVIWALAELAGGDVGTPSLADGFYLASYALDFVALFAAFRLRSLQAARGLLDASIVSIAVGFAGWHLLVEPQLARASLGTVVTLAYPLLDIAELMLLLTLGLAAQRMRSYSLLLVGASMAVGAVTDALSTYLASIHGYVSGGLLDAGWQAQALLLALAALVAVRREEPTTATVADPPDIGLVPVLVAAPLVVVVGAIQLSQHDTFEAVLLSSSVLAALVVRLLLTARAKDELASRLAEALDRQERLAVTDPLTGLHNRRFFDQALLMECERHLRSGRSLGLLVLDLDHFKSVNDSYGHAVGDETLRDVAARLEPALRRGDVVARFGGEEFVILLPETDARELGEIGERCRRAVADRAFACDGGIELELTISVGGACLPEDAGDAGKLLLQADKALYRAKALGRDQVQIGAAAPIGEESPDASSASEFLQRLGDRIDRLQHTEEQSREIARWARLLVRRLGLDVEAERRCALAARLHDIGKVAVPEPVLEKGGALDAHEWAMVREHPAHGARLVSLVPELRDVAPLIRDHHERPDGLGYPAGKRAGELDVEAAIVGVCDAWTAMRSDRPYRSRLDVEQARNELRAVKGSQFLAGVVDAFLEIEERGRREPDTEPSLVTVASRLAAE